MNTQTDPTVANPFSAYSTVAVPNSLPATPTATQPIAVPPQPTSSTDMLQSLVAQSTAGLNTAQTADKTAETNLQNSQTTGNSLQQLLMGETPDTIAAQQAQGIPQLNKDVRNLQLDIQSKQQKYLQGVSNIESGNIRSLSNNQNVALSRQNAIDVAISRSNLEATQGNLAYANELVSNAITAKYQPIKDALSFQNDVIKQNYDSLTRADKKLADAQLLNNTAKQKQIDQQIDDQKTLQSLSLTVAKNQAPQSVVNAIGKAGSFNDAVALAAPYLMSQADKTDIAYKVAQTAKLYSDIKNDAVTNGSQYSPQQTLAYAQQFASTGQIPTGIPKGSFGTIAQIAKELPKQNGEIVSTATGVKPTGDTTYTDALSSLASAVELAKQLKQLDAQRIGGVTAGTLGKVFGSEDQQRYVDLKDQISDLLSRARSGAALSAHEEALYGDMLPGRFSEPFGLGVNSDTRIDNFVNNLTSDLTNKASSKGLSIYGLSKIKADGKEYTVGDVITNGNGQAGRINADGTITLIQ